MKCSPATVEASLLTPRRTAIAAAILLTTIFAFCLQGYHPGAEDDGIYLSAVKHDLDPSLYPFNAGFLTLQLQATIFDTAVAGFTRLLHLPVAYACFLLQLSAIALLLLGCWRIAAFCFPGLRAPLAAVLTVACLLSLSVAGTALYIADEHLHPRTLATDAILFAVAAMQRGKRMQAAVLLVLALLFHPLMAMFGISFCIVYAASRGLAQHFDTADHAWSKIDTGRIAALPGSWLFRPVTPEWREALQQHTYYFPRSWEWYEWLGALAPPLLLSLLARLGRRRGNLPFLHLAVATACYTVAQLAIALAMLLPPALVRLTPLQPMRFLHLTFVLMAVLAGAALGEYVLQQRVARWLLVFLPLAVGNGYAQRLRYPATPNLELPWTAAGNEWLRTFAWVRGHTARDAVFALDPRYLALPGNDNHSFRALAERSSLADDLKDAAVVTQVPQLAATWVAQHQAQEGWTRWTAADFHHLADTTPARWVIVALPQAQGLACPYASGTLAVCRLK